MLDQGELAEKLRKVRDSRKNNRKQCARDILKFLEYEEYEKATEDQLDTMLIWAIDQHFGSSTDADVLLAAFGLLEGYHYSRFSLGKRRENILINSNVMKTALKVCDDYRSASRDRQKRLRDDNLHKAENTRILGLAGFLVEYLMKENIDSLMSDLNKSGGVKLPQPNYLLHKGARSPVIVDDKKNDALEQTTAFATEEEPQEQSVLHSETELGPEFGQEPYEAESSSSFDQESFRKKNDDNSIFKKLRIFIKVAPKATFFSHNTTDIHLHFFRTSPTDSKHRHKGIRYCCFAVVLLLIFVGYHLIRKYTMPPVSELFPTAEEIILSPNQVYELKVAILPDKAVGAPLSYISSNPEVATVSNKGFVLAHDIPQGAGCYTTDILIQAESGATAKKTVTVKISENVSIPPFVSEINSYEPNYTVEQKVRLAGEVEWKTEVDAKIGDKVEFQIYYRNTSNEDQRNVIIKDILPKNMRYIPGTTVIFNGSHKNGFIVDQDTVTDNGINIGNYGPSTSAYVRFTAELIDNTLQSGDNMLGNWSQCGIGQVILQDYTVVYTHKD